MVEMVEEGSILLGIFLWDYSNSIVGPWGIVDALQEGNEDGRARLLEEARAANQADELLRRWQIETGLIIDDRPQFAYDSLRHRLRVVLLPSA